MSWHWWHWTLQTFPAWSYLICTASWEFLTTDHSLPRQSDIQDYIWNLFFCLSSNFFTLNNNLKIKKNLKNRFICRFRSGSMEGIVSLFLAENNLSVVTTPTRVALKTSLGPWYVKWANKQPGKNAKCKRCERMWRCGEFSKLIRHDWAAWCLHTLLLGKNDKQAT